MDVILGIDIGGSTTKIVGLLPDGSVLSTLRVQAEDQVTSMYGALGNYLTTHGLTLSDIQQIVLTGVGSSYVNGNIFERPTVKVDEFKAIGTGALALSGLDTAMVVSMGTGTAFLYADRTTGIRHLCGSGVGGGTLSGLCRQMAKAERFQQINKMSVQGDLRNVNLMIQDVSQDAAETLDPTMTAANFGNLSEDATPEDLVAGAANLVLETIGTMTVLACDSTDCKTVVLTGAMTALEPMAESFERFERLYGIHYIVPENATFATAIGAGLYSLHNQALL